MSRSRKVNLLFLTTASTLIIGGVLYNSQLNEGENFVHPSHTASKVTPRPVLGYSSSPVPVFRYVTKSLTELGPMDERNPYALFLNQVPNSGGEILILLLQKLQGYNSFKHIRLKGSNRRLLDKNQQEELVYDVHDLLREEAVPLSFDRHVYFVNFSSFGRQSPTFVNLVRNPIDKVVSMAKFNNKGGRKNYFTKCLLDKTRSCNFKDGESYDLTIPYFCGQDPKCMLLNNNWALEQAKLNVERYYPVVSLLEHLNDSLKVLQHKLPFFFKGVEDLYKGQLLKAYNDSRKKQIAKDEKVENQLKITLVKELEFYEWLKQRLNGQISMT